MRYTDDGFDAVTLQRPCTGCGARNGSVDASGLCEACREDLSALAAEFDECLLSNESERAYWRERIARE